MTLILSRFRPRINDRFNDFTHAALHLFVKGLPFFELNVDRGKRPCESPRVLVVNHQSRLDPVVMISLEPRLCGPARGYLYRIPIIRSVLRLSGFYKADIGEIAPLEQMRLAIEEALANQRSQLFFPEGTRSKPGEISAFHLGAFRMAVEYELPIQPVVIEGLDRVFPRGSLIMKTRRRYPVHVNYLDPVKPPYGEGPLRRVVRDLANRVRLSMEEELKQLRAERETST
ncbi:lysophospholipid acyltransferase family protein [Thermodesulfobacteriota bacterium]